MYSVVDGPFNFDHSTLSSALLLATRYDYPALRTFSITKLENANLTAVERVRLAREFKIPSWEEPAYLELCERDEPLSMSDAEVLGLQAVVHVGRIREKEQRRRGKEVDARGETKHEVVEKQADKPSAIDAAITLVKVGSTGLPNPDKVKMTKGEGEEAHKDGRYSIV